MRTDRDTDYDENALEKDGGTLIMTSPDVLCRGVKKYCVSNGICEMTTVELPELKTAIVVVYRTMYNVLFG